MHEIASNATQIAPLVVPFVEKEKKNWQSSEGEVAQLSRLGRMDLNEEEVIELAARKVIAAVAEGDMLRTQLTILRRLSKHDSADTIKLRRQVAQYVLKAGKYAI